MSAFVCHTQIEVISVGERDDSGVIEFVAKVRVSFKTVKKWIEADDEIKWGQRVSLTYSMRH